MSAVCKYCGANNLHWEQTGDKKWQLLDKWDNRHKCIITKHTPKNAPNKLDISNDPKINSALKKFKERLAKENARVYYLKKY